MLNNKNFCQHHQTPLKALQILNSELDKRKLTIEQKLVIYSHIHHYLNESEFDVNLDPIQQLLEVQMEKLQAEIKSLKPPIKDIRDTLKELINKELEQLPQTLQELEPVQRINILCKLMPYVLPKVETIDYEPKYSDLKW